LEETQMAWLFVVVLWIHVLCMTFWLGSAVFGTILGGQERVQEALEAHELTRRLAPRLNVAFPAAIMLGVVCGILLGTVLGRVRTISQLLTTPYGVTMLVALVMVVVAVLVGPAGPPRLKRPWMGGVHLGELLLVGAFTCMMLMRVGL